MKILTNYLDISSIFLSYQWENQIKNCLWNLLICLAASEVTEIDKQNNNML